MGPGWFSDGASRATTLDIDLSGHALGPVGPLAGFASIIDNGQCGIAVEFIAPSDTATFPSGYLMSGASPDGLVAIRYNAAADHYILTVRGVDVLTLPATIEAGNVWTAHNQAFRAGDHVKIVATYHPASQLMTLQLFVNGCAGAVKTGAASGAALAPLTSLYVGSNIGANAIPAQFLRVTGYLYSAGFDSGCNAEIIIVSDSTGASRDEQIAIGSAIYTPSEATSRRGIASLAFPGATSVTMLAALQASRFASDGMVRVGVGMSGINDLVGDAQTAAQTSARQQALINAFAASNPLALIFWLTMTPCATYLAAQYPTAWNAVNTAIMGGGGTPLTGIHERINGHTLALDDGTGHLKSAYDVGDGIHCNNAGRVLIASFIRAALVSRGILS